MEHLSINQIYVIASCLIVQVVTSWTSWEDWSCSYNQGQCFQERSRYWIGHCVGDSVESQKCDGNICIDLKSPSWSEWSSWLCTYETGQCYQKRDRTCTHSSHGACHGKAHEFIPCQPSTCPVNTWTSWEPWKCLYHDDQCFQVKFRECHGKASGCSGVASEIATRCDPHICPAVQSWAEWESWSCFYKYGHCYQERKRKCHDLCNHGYGYELEQCDGVSCVDNRVPTWTVWTSWVCTNEQNQCFQTRFRVCSVNTDAACEGPSLEMKACNDLSCIATSWMEWGAWKCVYGADHCYQVRLRHCSDTVHGCPGQASEIAHECDSHTCPGPTALTVPGTWSEWSDWNCRIHGLTCLMVKRRICVPLGTCSGKSVHAEPCSQDICSTSIHSTVSSRASTAYTFPAETTTLHIAATLKSTTTTDAVFTPTPSTEAPKYISTTQTTPSPSPSTWSEWSAWKCEIVGLTCYMVKRRTCVVPDTCLGKFVHAELCSEDICSTSMHPAVSSSTSTANTIPAVALTTTRLSTSNAQPITEHVFTQVPTSIPSTKIPIYVSATPTTTDSSTTCAVCDGPEELCEHLYTLERCVFPNNYCVNRIVNHADSSRTVTRMCGSRDTCVQDWYQATSGNYDCMRFNEHKFTLTNFSCVFCCTGDNCNVNLRPPDNTLYRQ